MRYEIQERRDWRRRVRRRLVDPNKGRLENGWEQLVLSATVPVHDKTWGSVKELFKE